MEESIRFRRVLGIIVPTLFYIQEEGEFFYDANIKQQQNVVLQTLYVIENKICCSVLLLQMLR